MQIDLRGFLAFDWTLSLTHHGSYLNIDDILSTNDRLLCETRISLQKFASLLIGSTQPSKLSQSCTEDTIHESNVSSGTKLEIPLWLISAIGSSRRQMFIIELPIIYTVGLCDIFYVVLQTENDWYSSYRLNFGQHSTDCMSIWEDSNEEHHVSNRKQWYFECCHLWNFQMRKTTVILLYPGSRSFHNSYWSPSMS